MSDAPDSSYTRHLILKMLQRIVAKRISDMVIERLSDVQTDMYSFYALILNQFIENENKQFQFIREGIKAYSDPDGVWLAKDKADPPEHYVQSVALPLKLDQYLNTIVIDEKYDTFVFDKELVEEYFSVLDYRGEIDPDYVMARIHHDIRLNGDIFYADEVCYKVYESIDVMKFEADIDDYSYETILNSLLMSNSSIDEVENFLSKINEWTSYYEIYNLTSDIEKNIMSELMDTEIDKICSSTLINNPLVDNIRSKLGSIPIKEPPTLRKEGVDVNFLLDLDDMVDPISRISFYWSYRMYRHHSYTDKGASNSLRVARLILSDRDWLNDTCDMIKKNWLSEFKYNIYNTSIEMIFIAPSHRNYCYQAYTNYDFLEDYRYSQFSMVKFRNDYDAECIFYKINGLINIVIDESRDDLETYIDLVLKGASRCIRNYRTAQDNISIVFNLLNIILNIGRF